MKIALILIIGASALLGAPVTNRVPEWAVETFTATNLSLLKPYGELYIGAMPYGPTNIVISNSYTGTIQIGTNYWRVGEIRKLETWWAWTNQVQARAEFCPKFGHIPYSTRCVWIYASGPVEGPCFKCAVCQKEIAQQPGEWK